MSTDWYAPNQQAVGTEPAAATVAPTKTAAKKSTSKSKSEDDDE